MPDERAQLIQHIEELAKHAREADGPRQYNPESSRHKQIVLNKVSGVSQSDRDALGRELGSYFSLDQEGTLYRRYPNGRGLDPTRRMSEPLLARARLNGAEAALNDFERLFSANRVEFDEVVAIWGLHPRKAFELHDGIFLMPLSEVPPSRPRDILLGIPELANFREESGGFEVRARPRAALLRRVELSPVLYAENFDDSLLNRPRIDEMLIRLLTLATKRPVMPIGSWHQADPSIPLMGGVAGWGGNSIATTHRVEIEPEDLDADNIRSSVSQYFKLPKAHAQRLKIVLGRLNAAKGDQSNEDRAIDLGIALEALLFNPDDSNTEITFKFKVRGAVLASSNHTRKTVASLLGRLYTLRSRAAHGSTFGVKEIPYWDTLEDGVELTTQLIQRVLSLGRIPENWNGLVLGWEHLPAEEPTT